VTTQQLILLIAVALYAVGVIVAALFVFSAFYLGDDDMYEVQPGDVADD
jgi:hypothetical protein